MNKTDRVAAATPGMFAAVLRDDENRLDDAKAMLEEALGWRLDEDTELAQVPERFTDMGLAIGVITKQAAGAIRDICSHFGVDPIGLLSRWAVDIAADQARQEDDEA